LGKGKKADTSSSRRKKKASSREKGVRNNLDLAHAGKKHLLRETSALKRTSTKKRNRFSGHHFNKQSGRERGPENQGGEGHLMPAAKGKKKNGPYSKMRGPKNSCVLPEGGLFPRGGEEMTQRGLGGGIKKMHNAPKKKGMSIDGKSQHQRSRAMRQKGGKKAVKKEERLRRSRRGFLFSRSLKSKGGGEKKKGGLCASKRVVLGGPGRTPSIREERGGELTLI